MIARIYIRFSHFTCVGEMQVKDLRESVRHFNINSLFVSGFALDFHR